MLLLIINIQKSWFVTQVTVVMA